MGDSKRFSVLANFIARNYPPCKVADVAGGIGLLSYYLNQHGFSSTVIDPRKVRYSPKYSEQISQYHFSQLSRQRSMFSPSMYEDFDLIVGLHPDEATEVVCHAALHRRPFVVVPCCHYWSGTESHGSPNMRTTIYRFLKSHHVRYYTTTLPFSGKNVVIWTKDH